MSLKVDVMLVGTHFWADLDFTAYMQERLWVEGRTIGAWESDGV